jgi:hypothetical protein
VVAPHPCGKDAPQLAIGVTPIKNSGNLTLDLSTPTKDFIEEIDHYGSFRYLEISNVATGRLVALDRSVWELRRFCTLDPIPAQAKLQQNVSISRVCLAGGRLEDILSNTDHPVRRPFAMAKRFFLQKVRRWWDPIDGSKPPIRRGF